MTSILRRADVLQQLLRSGRVSDPPENPPFIIAGTDQITAGRRPALMYADTASYAF